jgi:DNA-directed RNA polymerase subunit RPC12/RpoP
MPALPPVDTAAPALALLARAAGLRCPHCGLQALPAWRKWALGWDRPVACRACGLGVKVSGWHATRATLPLVGGAFALAVYGGLARGLPGWAMPVLVLLGVASVLAYLFAVPLQRAGHTDAHAVRQARQQAGERGG